MKNMFRGILILNLGGVSAQDYSKIVRKYNVFSHVVFVDGVSAEKVKELNPEGIVLCGKTSAEETLNIDKQIFELGIPVLTIEDGTSVVASLFGEAAKAQVATEEENIESQLTNFMFDICNCKKDWTAENFIDKSTEETKAQVGDGSVLLGLSGGVDSTVTAALLYKAIGSRLHCVFVDHGFMRKGEPELVKKIFTEYFPVSLTCVDARQRFMDKLKDVNDPEKKRKIIGAEFIEVFKEEAKKLGKLDHFAQGTIYPDIIESGTAGAGKLVKSHHNVGGLPKELGFTSLVEPLKYLFKPEVRKIGSALGLPDEFVLRQPFPGPGLSVRCLGILTPERVDLVRESDAILREEIAKAGLQQFADQYFTVLPGIRSVGVKDGERVFYEAIAIRAVKTTDFMTADWVYYPKELLNTISNRILNEVPGINRVLLDISPKPPASIEWE
ncbi:MAG: glutamine-hydrolyzing GMP synthase [Eubacteriales bacterium]|nr:glutamine-hydrolyzing GMP synthase [Eubacteriales bacterium]